MRTALGSEGEMPLVKVFRPLSVVPVPCSDYCAGGPLPVCSGPCGWVQGELPQAGPLPRRNLERRPSGPGSDLPRQPPSCPGPCCHRQQVEPGWPPRLGAIQTIEAGV